MSPVPPKKTRLMARKLFFVRLFHLKAFCFKDFLLQAGFSCFYIPFRGFLRR